MNTTRVLTVGDKVFYSIGQLAESMKNLALAVFILFYYNSLLGMNPMLAGLAMLIALIVDSATDPLIGAVSDRWRSRFGRRHFFMYLAIVPFLITFYLLFAPPESLLPARDAPLADHMPLFAWLTGTGIAARVVLTFFTVPHLALGAELSSDYKVRTVVASWREAVTAIGSLLVYGIAFGWFFAGPRGQLETDAYPSFALTLAVIMSAAMLISAAGTHHLIPYLHQPARRVRMSAIAILAETLQAFRNLNFRWYFTGALMIYMVVGIDTALLLYVNTYIWEISGRPLLWVSVALFVGYFLGSPFTPRLHGRFDKKPVLMWGTTWFAVLQMLPVVLWLFGWMPPAATAALVMTLSVMRIVQGIGTVQSRSSGNSMLADVADEYELQSGKRQEGVFFGAQLVAYKATSGLGKFVSGILLGLIGWPTAQQIAVDGVSHDKLVWLALMYGPFVAILAVVSVWCYSRYQLDAERHRRIVEELQERRRDHHSRAGGNPSSAPGWIPACAGVTNNQDGLPLSRE
jgi:Na+/melibiose symporter-like transporter